MGMYKRVVRTNQAPAAIGPYSQGMIAANLVFCSGQIPLDPATGNLVSGSIETQTRRALDNVVAVLKAAGTSCRQVVKTTIFLQDMNDFQKVNAIYGEYFSEPYPARSTIQVAKLPLGAAIEIEAVAVV